MKRSITIIFLLLAIWSTAQTIRNVSIGGKVNLVPGAGGSSSGTTGAFTFTITGSKHSSAGVYKNDSILVRTLWNNDSSLAAGTYTGYWDGKDENGKTTSSAESLYKVKVETFSVKYAWQGTIGNSSDNMTGASKYRGYRSFNGLTFGSTYGYYCTGYSEGFSSLGKFKISTPNTRTAFFSGASIVGDIKYCTTDGTTVYWAATDSYSSNYSFVFGTNVSNDAEKNFSSGVSYKVTYGKTYNSAISRVNTPGGDITGLAVGKSYLFVSRAGLNNLYVHDKNTGTPVRTVNFTNVRSICVDGDDKLWVLHSVNTIERYTINGDGTLTLVFTLTGPIDAKSISYGNGMIAVCDGGRSQQVKFYHYTTGLLISTLGTPGGYQTDATVSNSKFLFSTARITYVSFVAWQSDNSYWVGDLGNSRAQHYNSNNIFVNRIAFLGPTYSTWVDKNNINRVFAGFYEYAVDYSVQTLTGAAGWTLVKNWGANINLSIYNDGFNTLKPVTLSNGRTYSLINKGNDVELVELVAGGMMRFTGITRSTLTSDIWFLCEDGSLQVARYGSLIATIKRYAFSSFDGSNNIVWSITAETLATATTDNIIGNPASPFWTRTNALNSHNKVVWFNPSPYARGTTVVHTGHHLGLMQRGANNIYLFQTEKSTHRNYRGTYPGAGWFEVGNDVSDFAGGNVNIVGRYIITSYHGEGYKQTQANMYNLYLDNGLAIGQFGTTRPATKGESAAGMAGNALTPVVVEDGNGNLYLYHGDESDHSGVHRWKISGLNTIAEQVIPINFPTTYSPVPVNYIDLMAGLPFDAKLTSGTAGWTRTPTSDINVPFGNKFIPRTSMQSYNPLTENDITIEFFNSSAITDSVSKNLGDNTASKRWKITGELGYPGNNVNYKSSVVIYIDVLDNSNKPLTTLVMEGDNTNTTLKGNGATIVFQAGATINNMGKMQPFQIEVTGNTRVTFTFAGYRPVTTSISDRTANWQTPKTFRIRLVAPAGAFYGNTISIRNLKLYTF